MKSKWIIGGGDFLDYAHYAWKQALPDESVQKIVVSQGKDYAFDMQVFDGLNPAEGTMFVAFDERFGNFKRMELMQAALERGFQLEAFVSPHAMLAINAKIGMNAFVSDGVIIGHDSRIGYNSVLLPGVQIGSGVHINPSCWLESGVVVGNNAQIGTHSTLRMGTLVSPKVKVGRNCELGWAQRYDKNIEHKTTFDPRYNEPIYVYGI